MVSVFTSAFLRRTVQKGVFIQAHTRTGRVAETERKRANVEKRHREGKTENRNEDRENIFETIFKFHKTKSDTMFTLINLIASQNGKWKTKIKFKIWRPTKGERVCVRAGERENLSAKCPEELSDTTNGN